MKQTFNKNVTFERTILPLIKELKLACVKEGLPMFIAVCTSDDGKKTEYHKDVVSAKTHDIVLSQDIFADLINVTLGFKTVNPGYKELELNIEDFNV